MEPRERRQSAPRREGTASTKRIVLTLAGILAGVAVLGWAVFALAGLLIPAAPAAPTTASLPTGAVAAKTTTSALAVKTDSAIPSESSTAVAKAAPAPAPAVAPAPAPASKPAPKATTPAPAANTANSKYVVVIDPGHQAQANLSLEPIGPGSTTKKPRVEGGATGVSGRPESLDNLQIALKIRDVLQAQGVKVVMVRTTQDVNIPNSKRAQIANAAHANLFLRIHCDSGPSNITGILTLVPGKDRWTGPIVAPSARAGRDVQSAVVAATHHPNRGITSRTDLSGFNYATVPSVLVECGMMSNKVEDRDLASSSYQQTLARGISAGVVRYLHGQ